MDLFPQIVSVVLEREGGLTQDPHDPGGITNWGISSRFCRENNINLQIPLLTQDQAKFIYHKYFWLPYGFPQLTQEPIALKVFDTAVNIGPREAILIAQDVVSIDHHNLAIDGILGPITAELLNSMDAAVFLDKYKQQQAQYYQELVAHNSSLQEFLSGWLHRAAM